ncbi:MAG: hypothetical protein JWL84_720 [Rhodospirillales bacterium]|nr:hypothetical protein [Rhodospirillales bacterium]
MKIENRNRHFSLRKEERRITPGGGSMPGTAQSGTSDAWEPGRSGNVGLAGGITSETAMFSSRAVTVRKTMRPVAQIIYIPVAALMLVAASGGAADAHRCDVFLPDGRIIRSERAFDGQGRTCDEFFSGRRGRGDAFFATRRHSIDDRFARPEFEFRQTAPRFERRPMQQPRIGFTTGSIGPFTTFSNSPPPRRR